MTPPQALGQLLPIDRRLEPRAPAPLPAIRPVLGAASSLLRHVAAVAPAAAFTPEPAAAEPATEPGDDFEVTEELLLPPAPARWRLLAAWGLDAALVTALPLLSLAASTRGATGAGGEALGFAALVGEAPVALALLAMAALTAFVYLFLSAVLGGRTLGHRLTGLEVIVRESGAAVGVGRAALRAALAVAGTFAFLAGPLWALFDEEGQAFHDKVAGTLVVREE